MEQFPQADNVIVDAALVPTNAAPAQDAFPTADNVVVDTQLEQAPTEGGMPTPDNESVDVSLASPDMPSHAPTQAHVEPGMWEKALTNIVAPAIQGLQTAGRTVGNTVEGMLTNQTVAQVEAADAKEKASHNQAIPAIPDVPGLTRNANVPKSMPGIKDRILDQARADALAKLPKDQLTDSQKTELSQLQAKEKMYAKFMPLPKPPTTMNEGPAGLIAHITPEEIGVIAQQYGIDPQKLMDAASIEGGYVEQDTPNDLGSVVDKVRRGVGQLAGNLDAFQLGSYGNRVFATPEERRALEDMRDILAERQGKGRIAAQLATGLLTGSSLTKGLQAGAKAIGGTSKAIQSGVAAADMIGQAAVFSETSTNKGDSATANFAVGAPLIVLAPLAGPALRALGNTAAEIKQAASTAINAKRIATQAANPKLYVEAAAYAAKEAPDAIVRLEELLVKDAAQISPEEVKYLTDVGKKLGIHAEDGSAQSILNAFEVKSTQEPQAITEGVTKAITASKFESLVNQRVEQSAKSSLLARIADYISAAPMAGAVYDAKHGTAVMQTLDAMSADAHLAGALTNEYATRLEGIAGTLREMKQAGKYGATDAEILSNVYKQAESAAPLADPLMNSVREQFKDFYASARQYYTKVGRVNVAELEGLTKGGLNYMPRRSLRGNDLAMAFIDRCKAEGVDVERLWKPGGMKDQATIERLLKSDVAQGLQLVSKQPVDQSNIIELLTSITRPGGSQNMDDIVATMQSIAALKQRGGVMPVWMVDHNPVSAAMGYIDDLNKMTYVKPHVEQLKHFRDIAGRLSSSAELYDKDMYTFLDNTVNGLGGGKQTWIANGIKRAQAGLDLSLRIKASNATSPAARAVYKMLATAPQGLMGHIRSTMYSGFLGVHNLKAPLQNLAQPVLMGLPEVGNAYGAELLLKALPKATSRSAVDALPTVGKAWSAVRGSASQAPRPQFASSLSESTARKVGELQASLQHGIGTGFVEGAEGSRQKQVARLMRGDFAKQGFVGATLDKVTDASMGLFQASERFSRNWSALMADGLTKDLLAGRKEAITAIGNFKGSYGQSIMNRLKAGDEQGVQTLVRNYIIGRTVLNYDRASQAAFTRMMGPIFSSFTRWPTEGIGRLAYGIRTDGAMHAGIKAAGAHGPILAALFLADQALQNDQSKQEFLKNDSTARTLMGQEGLIGWSFPNAVFQAVRSVGAMTGGIDTRNAPRMYSPPVLEAVTTLVPGAAGMALNEEGSPEYEAAYTKLIRGLDVTTDLTVPGASFGNLVTRTLPNLAGENLRGGLATRMTEQD